MSARSKSLDFAECLKKAEAAGRALRDLVLELQQAPPEDHEDWLAVMVEPGTAKGVGALLVTVQKTSEQVEAMAQSMAQYLATYAPAAIPAFQSHFIAGETDAEMACPCGDSCPACVLRKKIGDENARQEIADTLRAQLHRPRRRAR